MTYLPGQAVVPCAQCGQPIYRRGASGLGHRKYCSEDCYRDGSRLLRREQRGQSPRRADGICPRCNTNPRPLRPNGKRRGWCNPCEAKQKAEYMRSEAGQATMQRYLEKHGYTIGPTEAPCLWCGETVSRRGALGAGQRKFCSTPCGLVYNMYRKKK